MLPQALLSLISLPPLVSAHFKLVYPPARGFNEDTLPNGPCGGQSESNNRTTVSLTSMPVVLDMGHDQTAVQMLLGLGNDPGNNFNVVIHQTFGIEGEGDFCLSSVTLPANVGLMDGMNATLQVVANGDNGGGLYNCADITFTNASESTASSCKNGTGITATAFPAAQASINANQSLPTGGAQSGGSSSSSASGSSSATGSSTQPTAGASMAKVTWGVLGAAALGVAALL